MYLFRLFRFPYVFHKTLSLLFSHSISLLVCKSLVLPRYHYNSILFGSYFVNPLFSHKQSLVQLLLFVSLWFRQGKSLSLWQTLVQILFCQSLVPSHPNSLLFSSYFLSVSGSVTVSVTPFHVSCTALILSVSCSVTITVFHFDSLLFSSYLYSQSLVPARYQSFTLTVSFSALIFVSPMFHHVISLSLWQSLVQLWTCQSLVQLWTCQSLFLSRYQYFSLTVPRSVHILSVSCSVTQSIFYFNSILFSSYFSRVQSLCKFLVYLVW